MEIRKSMLVDVAETLARKMYNLDHSYAVHTFSAKASSFDLTMCNSLLTVKVTFPLGLLEDHCDALEEEQIQEDVDKAPEEVIDEDRKRKVRKRINKK